MRTASMLRFAGKNDLMTAGDVPGGKEDRRRVGFGAALSCILARSVWSSSSSKFWKAALVSKGPVFESSKAKSP